MRVRFNMANPGGSSCRLRYHCAGILMRHSFAVWQERPKTDLRLAGFWHSQRSTMGQHALRRRRSAVSGFRSSGIGCCASTPAVLTVSWMASRRDSRPSSTTLSGRPPIPAVHGVVRWRLIDLSQWIFEEFRITIAKQTLRRELRAMGYRKLSARPRHHAQVEGAIEDFKKAFPRAWRPLRARRRLTATR